MCVVCGEARIVSSTLAAEAFRRGPPAITPVLQRSGDNGALRDKGVLRANTSVRRGCQDREERATGRRKGGEGYR